MATTDWKAKATEYAREKKQLKKRIREITKSRDEWKEKSMRYKVLADHLLIENKKRIRGFTK